MSFFGVTIETIKSVEKAPNSDRLHVVRLESLTYQFVTNVPDYKPGDRVVYFPVDSVLPVPLMRHMDMIKKDEAGAEVWEGEIPVTMLAGPEKNRVKTVRLRGTPSQGVVAPFDLLTAYFCDLQGDYGTWGALPTSEEITKAMGVVKYDPPVYEDADAYLTALPGVESVYDIESAERYAGIIGILRPMRVSVTEKLEGENFSVTVVMEDGEHQVYVNSHGSTLIPKDGRTPLFWRLAKEQGLIVLARRVIEETGAPKVTVYGEAVGPGIRKNIYRRKENEVYLFDIKVNEDCLDPEDFDLCAARCLTVPYVAHDVVLDEWLAGRTLAEASSGRSLIGDCLREGIVVRPMKGWRDLALGRVILKQRDPVYLDKTGN